ncbi:YhcB family protein [Flocculibacter collagenilyticus]|uniref:YhcB family protein n=1 Tax=Flocculibacter collagenilyticus TaxID=2744479 RepID=UPI0018F2A039|nr:YhcB family protein [Flocculibacter collagenilyticus]
MSFLSTTLIAIVTFLVGLIIGRVWTKRQISTSELQQQVEQTQNELTQYKQDIASHFATTNALMSQLKHNYEEIVTHVDQTSKMLQRSEAKGDLFPFFSKETTEQLQASLDQLQEEKRNKHTPDSQPQDYSQGSSGLLNADKEKSVG